MSFVIATDTSANLPSEEIKSNDFLIIPFSYIVNGEAHETVDPDAFDGHAFYEMLKKTSVTTSLINEERFREFLEPVVEAGNDVLYVGMSSGISGAYDCSVRACRELSERYPDRRIRTFDTMGASLGEGIHALKAAKLRDEGVDIDDVLSELERTRLDMCQLFTVDDLINLKRGGRVSTAKAAIGTILNIKPLLRGDEMGRIDVYSKVRGKKAAIKAMADRCIERIVDASSQTVGIAHADCPEDAAALESILRENLPIKGVMTVCYEPVTGSHVGAGALALFFFGTER